MNISKLIQRQNERFLYIPTKNETRLFIQNISAYKSSFHVKWVIAISIFFVVLCKLDISSDRETLFNDIQSGVHPHELISYNATCDFKLKKSFTFSSLWITLRNIDTKVTRQKQPLSIVYEIHGTIIRWWIVCQLEQENALSPTVGFVSY